MFPHMQLTTLRGTVLEECIPSAAKTGTSKGIPPRDVVDYITQGEIQPSTLKLGKNEKKVCENVQSYLTHLGHCNLILIFAIGTI